MAAVPLDPPAAATVNPAPASGGAKPAADPTETTAVATPTAAPASETTTTEPSPNANTGEANGKIPLTDNTVTDDQKTTGAPMPLLTTDAAKGNNGDDQHSDLPPNTATTTSTRSPRTSTTACGACDTRGTSFEVDNSKPADFEGEIATNDHLPTAETLKKIENYVVLDRHGKSHPFKSLYTGRNVARRVLIIFVRHFFCGNCQEFLRSLSESVTPDALLGLPMSTFIAVVGCGNPGLIDMYLQETGCPFPVYTDPTRRLFEKLGMTRTLALGERPAYMRKSMFKSAAESVFQGLKQVKSGLATKSGDHRQVGGEFLFEPVELSSPVSTPFAERQIEEALQNTKREDISQEGIDGEGGDDNSYEPEVKKVTWCHRMRSTRDHAEIPELMEILGLTGTGKPVEDSKRWSKALETRKGTGLSLASQMSKLSDHQERA
ncbi:uncharacterized protein CTRU02_200252 [Colletotrichum truncatum]|uniref:Uncharacterized protein n=1 Tax=Colletotrichum truncatum TaxID=5467 RepID=A0ACC3ZE24_COLTU|nr:uncharacterized protein CTRU02_00006 [Colletotrichum truncatum]KAF6801257.1 hypothetical protein CTRU02_00006 [Colletotrichum truncatum]